MSIKTGDIIRLGTKANGTMYRIESIDLQRWISATGFGDRTGQWYREVRLTRIDDGSTWKVDVKADAVRVPWNIRASRITTQDDRTRAIEEARGEDDPNYIDEITTTPAQLAEQIADTIDADDAWDVNVTTGETPEEESAWIRVTGQDPHDVATITIGIVPDTGMGRSYLWRVTAYGGEGDTMVDTAEEVIWEAEQWATKEASRQDGEPRDEKLEAFAADPSKWGDPESVLTGPAAAAAARADLEAAGLDVEAFERRRAETEAAETLNWLSASTVPDAAARIQPTTRRTP